MGAIFISYRRDDSRHAAGRLVDRLNQTYRRDQIFMDVDSISVGLDFVQVLGEKVSACEAMLVVIGPGWINASDNEGRRRLDDSHDFVRNEVEQALKRNVRVIPVLVDGAQMPTPQQLPPSMQALARRQATRLSHERFGVDADGLVATMQGIVTPDASLNVGVDTKERIVDETSLRNEIKKHSATEWRLLGWGLAFLAVSGAAGSVLPEGVAEKPFVKFPWLIVVATGMLWWGYSNFKQAQLWLRVMSLRRRK